jgi:hypothetical protein
VWWLATVLALSASPPAAQKAKGLDEALKDEALAVGAVSGRAEACELDWKPHYETFMAAKRADGVSDLDMVFVGAYHGAGQGNAASEANGECPDDMRKQTQKEIDANLAKYKK